MFFKRREVDEWEVSRILYDFLYPTSLSLKMIICYEISRKGDVIIRSNRPGVIIGVGGKNIEQLTYDLQTKANVRKVKLFELRNCLVSGWRDGLQRY